MGKIAANISRALTGMVNDSKGTETATLSLELGEEWRTMALLLETVGVRAAGLPCFDFVVSRWFAPNDHSMLEARIPRLTEGQVCRILTTALQDDKMSDKSIPSQPNRPGNRSGNEVTHGSGATVKARGEDRGIPQAAPQLSSFGTALGN